METTANPLGFRDIRNQYRQAKETNPFFQNLDLRDFATLQNSLTQTHAYDSGLDQGMGLWAKQASAGIDDLLEATGLPQASEDLFGSIGAAFGAEEGGRQAGRELPRNVVDFLPAMLAGLASGGSFWALMGASAGLSAMNAYEKTDDPGAAAWAAATLPMGIGASAIGGKAAVGLGSKLTKGKIGMEVLEDGSKVAKNWLTTGTEFVGSEMAAEGVFQGIAMAESGQGLDYFTRDNIFQTLVEELPFSVVDVVTTPRPASARARKSALKEMDMRKADEPNEMTSSMTKFDREGYNAKIDEAISGIPQWLTRAKQQDAEAYKFGYLSKEEYQEALKESEYIANQAIVRLSELRKSENVSLNETLMGMEPKALANFAIEKLELETMFTSNEVETKFRKWIATVPDKEKVFGSPEEVSNFFQDMIKAVGDKEIAGIGVKKIDFTKAVGLPKPSSIEEASNQLIFLGQSPNRVLRPILDNYVRSEWSQNNVKKTEALYGSLLKNELNKFEDVARGLGELQELSETLKLGSGMDISFTDQSLRDSFMDSLGDAGSLEEAWQLALTKEKMNLLNLADASLGIAKPTFTKEFVREFLLGDPKVRAAKKQMLMQAIAFHNARPGVTKITEEQMLRWLKKADKTDTMPKEFESYLNLIVEEAAKYREEGPRMRTYNEILNENAEIQGMLDDYVAELQLRYETEPTKLSPKLVDWLLKIPEQDRSQKRADKIAAYADVFRGQEQAEHDVANNQMLEQMGIRSANELNLEFQTIAGGKGVLQQERVRVPVKGNEVTQRFLPSLYKLTEAPGRVQEGFGGETLPADGKITKAYLKSRMLKNGGTDSEWLAWEQAFPFLKKSVIDTQELQFALKEGLFKVKREDTATESTKQQDAIALLESAGYQVDGVDYYVHIEPPLPDNAPDNIRDAYEYLMSGEPDQTFTQTHSDLASTSGQPLTYMLEMPSSNFVSHGLDNVVGWVRGGIIEGPEGKTYVVDEVQSDYGQRKKELEQAIKTAFSITHSPSFRSIEIKSQDDDNHIITHYLEAPARLDNPGTREGMRKVALDVLEAKFPLGDKIEGMLVKIAFDAANQEGVNRIIFADSNTARITEGHVNRPEETSSFDAGMKAAYDERIPNLAKKTAGVAGHLVTYGPHKRNPMVAARGYAFDPKAAINKQMLRQTQGKTKAEFQLRSVLVNTFTQYGMDKRSIERAVTFVEEVGNILGIKPDQFGLLVDNEGLREVVGAQGIIDNLNTIFLGASTKFADLTPSQKADAHGYVLAHEISHRLSQAAKNNELSEKATQIYNDMQGWVATSTREERIGVLEVLHDAYGKALDLKDLRNSVDDSENYLATLNGLMSLAKVKDGKSEMMPTSALLPAKLRHWFGLVRTYIRQMMNGIKDAFFINGDKASFENMTFLTERFDSLAQEMNRANALQDEFSTITNLSPVVLSMNDVEMINWHRGTVNDVLMEFSSVHGRVSNLGDKFLRQLALLFETPNTLANRIPEFAGARTTLIGHGRNVRASINRMMAPLFGGESALTAAGSIRQGFLGKTKAIREYEEVIKPGTPVNKALTALMLKQNTGSGARPLLDLGELMKRTNDPVTKELNKLSPDERDLVFRQFAAHVAQKKAHETEMVETFTEGGTWAIAQYMSRKMDYNSFKEASRVGSLLMEAARVETLEPELSQTIYRQASLAAGSRNASDTVEVDKAVAKAYGIAKRWQTQIEKIQQMFTERPGEFSELRVGNIEIRWQEGEESKVFRVADKAAAAEFVKQLPDTATGVQQVQLDKRSREFVAFNDNMFQFLQELDAERDAFIKTLDIDLETREEISKASSFSTELLAVKDDILGPKNLPYYSTGVGGREYINMPDLQRIYTTVLGQALANMKMNLRMRYELSNPKLDKYPEQKQEIQQMMENYKVKDPELGRSITKLNFVRYMGLNFSSHILESTQALFTVVPQIIKEQGFSGAFPLLGKAAKEVGEFSIKYFQSMGKKSNLELWGDQETAHVFDQAAQDGAISSTFLSDILDQDAADSYRKTSVIHKGKIGTMYDIATSGVNLYTKAATNVFAAVAHTNARVALKVGWEMAKKKNPGLKPQWKDGKMNEDARILMEDAYRFMDMTTFSGGRANRPTTPFRGDNPLTRGTAMAAFSLQGYNLGVIGQAITYAQQGFGKNTYGFLTPKQRSQARQALAYQTLAFFGAAGMMGMPFVGPAIAALEENTELEIHKGMREQLARLVDDPQIQDMILHGVANNWIAGADVGNRFAVGVPGTDAYRGFDPGAIAGPMGSTIQDFLRAARVMSEGQNPISKRSAEAFELVAPVAWKKVINMARNDMEFRDLDGNLLIDGTTAQKMSYLAGFTPTEVRKLKEIKAIQRRSQEIARLEEKRFIESVADTFGENPVRAQEMLAQKARDSKETFDYAQASRKVATTLENRNFPYDIRRQGTAVSASKDTSLLSSTGWTASPSEAARTNYRNQILRMLGVDAGESQRQAIRAQLIDQLMMQDAFITRARAASMADDILSGRRTDLASPQASAFPQANPLYQSSPGF